MKRILLSLLAAFLVASAAEANQALTQTGVTTNGNTVDVATHEFHVATLCVTVASGALTSIQIQTKDAAGNYYPVGVALTATGCTSISDYATSGGLATSATVGLGGTVRAIWSAGTANFSYSLYLKR